MDTVDVFLLVCIMILIFRIKIKYETFENSPDAYISVNLKSKQDLVFA